MIEAADQPRRQRGVRDEVSDDLLARYDVRGPRYTSYPTVPAWADDVDAEVYRDALGRAGRRLSLYVHLPFCEAMCSYCACNVVVSRSRSRADDYLDTLEAELEMVTAALGGRRRLAQVHWGGGTPTFLTEAQLTRLWTLIERLFVVDHDAEIAVEIDPMVTTEGQLRLLAEHGFNRLSMGVQDLDERVQQAIGRGQTMEGTARVVDLARALGFQGINLDLIYGLPEQTRPSWARTVERILDLGPDRLAIYSFAHLPDRQPHQRKLDAAAMPRGREKLRLFLAARDRLIEAGWTPIGLDHFARPGDELALARRDGRLGRNFQGYTVRSAPETVAVGASAISDVGGLFAQNLRAMGAYTAALRSGLLPIARGHRLSADDRRRRQLVSELMCNLSTRLTAEEAAGPLSVAIMRLEGMVVDGLVRLSTDPEGVEVEVTDLGQILLRNVAMVFDAYLSEDATSSETFSRTV